MGRGEVRGAARGAAAVGALLTVCAAGPLVHPGVAAGATFENVDPGSICATGDQDRASAVPGAPATRMRIQDSHDWLAQNGYQPAGTGVVVAVLDSGVAAAEEHVTVLGQQISDSTFPGATFYHGNAVAGLIAGAPDSDGTVVGIAPAAQIIDVKVYDGPDDGGSATDEGAGVSSNSVTLGLEQLVALKPTLPGLKIVNVSARVDDTAALKIAVKKLYKLGVLVVAASGNRDFENDDPLYERYQTYQAGENAAKVIYPAGYDQVLAVAATADGIPGANPLDSILQNSQIDVAVPTSGAVAYTPQGVPCVLRSPATSWAAAEVSGVLAMLASTYPDDTIDQLRSRLVDTATGRVDLPNPITGAGVVQPYEALTRPAVIGPDGAEAQVVPVEEQQVAELPPVETDPLGDTRHDMVWFGVLGGGVLVLALVLRPVLARRRRTA